VTEWTSTTLNIFYILTEIFRDLIQATQDNVGRCMTYEVVAKSPAERPSLQSYYVSPQRHLVV
jgi:hypothetical protein